jgi:REP element-mobilizing transposase RayT
MRWRIRAARQQRTLARVDMNDMQQNHGARGAYTRGYLPHFDYEGVFQMVTFRLADALPLSIGAAGPRDFAALDAELDRGRGNCVLRRPDAGGVVRDALHFFDGSRYVLGPWVIMPNHVHVVFRTFPGYALGDVLHSWKSFTAKQINRLLGTSGPIWQREYFDRVLRGRRHFEAVAHYIHQNPVTAGLAEQADAWPLSSASLGVPGAGETPADRRRDGGAP